MGGERTEEAVSDRFNKQPGTVCMPNYRIWEKERLTQSFLRKQTQYRSISTTPGTPGGANGSNWGGTRRLSDREDFHNK
jgi:hypothetical protein